MNRLSWVTNMRIFAVLGIVVIHCNDYFTELGAGRISGLYNWCITVFFKPATIIFFIISGYLFEAKFATYKSNSFGKFILKKIKNLLIPYFFIYIFFNLTFKLFIEPNFGAYTYDIDYIHEVAQFFRSVFFSNYWFLPVLFLYVGINYFIKSSNCYRLFWISIFITIFYSLNIYFHFTKYTVHTAAIPGFMTFFLFGRLVFLGIFSKIRMNFNIVFLTLLIALAESYFLGYDANTIRLSNVIYSFSFFLWFKDVSQKIKIPHRISNVNYYFIYLVHPIVMLHIVDRFLVLYTVSIHSFVISRNWIYFSMVLIITLVFEKVLFSFSNPISLMFNFKRK